MKGPSNGFQVVMAPSVFLVTLPGMPKSCHNCRLSFIWRPCNNQKCAVLYTNIDLWHHYTSVQKLVTWCQGLHCLMALLKLHHSTAIPECLKSWGKPCKLQILSLGYAGLIVYP
jgi:hypothetical protein